jgi:hypothetical protein
VNRIRGKALLVIERDADRCGEKRWIVLPYIQSCSGGGDARDCVEDDFQHLEYDTLPLPPQAYKLAVGETIRVSVTYEFTHHQSCEGDWDVDLDYGTIRVLRRQKPRKFYVSKARRLQ